jgi:hypothetical protein
MGDCEAAPKSFGGDVKGYPLSVWRNRYLKDLVRISHGKAKVEILNPTRNR